MGPRRSRSLMFRVVVGALAVALAATGCGGDGGNSQEDGENLRTVKVALSIKAMNSSFAAISVARYLGYFKEEGLKVETTFTPGSTQAIQAVAAGQMDMAAPVPQALIPDAVKNDSDQRMFFNWARSQVASFAVEANSPIRNWTDFRGKKIGAQSLGSGTIPLAQALLREQGMDPDKDVKFVSVGLEAGAYHALQSKRVDALMLFDSQYAAMENLGAKLRYFKSSLSQQLFSTGFSAKQSYMKANPKVIEGFGRAMAKANVFTTANPEAAIKMMYEIYPKTNIPGVPEDKKMEDNKRILALRTTHIISGDPDAGKNWGSFPEEGVKAWSDFSVATKLTPTAFKAEQFVTNEFVPAFNDFDPQKIKTAAKNYRFEG
ncbi:NitT/TauT family transport system substrate-binding protein [Actinomadura pelletieri DSM 43383]|uniref:Thiamine pyrimidine synthase n=2 Tax=Actinomadura pelletieri TaxID=111805 RepID=A0A495QKV9_9ACTN|nr:NitT/TauT family transport system substrate-binding protein [Actinomadura pelletieri DSM 43383]